MQIKKLLHSLAPPPIKLPNKSSQESQRDYTETIQAATSWCNE
jgi:hypothetical protein